MAKEVKRVFYLFESKQDGSRMIVAADTPGGEAFKSNPGYTFVRELSEDEFLESGIFGDDD